MADDLFEQQLKSARQMLERDILAGSVTSVENVLELYPAIAAEENAVVDLIYNEHLIRQEQGESSSIDEFLNRFPKYEQRIVRLFSIHSTLEAGETVADDNSLLIQSDNINIRQRQLAAGDLIGSFELIKKLGHGGKGIVYKARQVELDRTVALKILRNNISDEHDIRQLMAEAKASASLHHPNIVQVFEINIADGCPYISLEFVEDGSLEEKSSGNPISALEAANIIADIAQAMHYAHCQGVVHRDLKPSNILLTSDGVPKVTDFGLAMKLPCGAEGAPLSIAETGVIIGTPSFMAPEQALGLNRDVGPKTDVYGLGAVLYQLLTGQAPFVGESTFDTLQNIQLLDPVPPAQHNPKVPRDLETICLKCLEKDRLRRYASAADLEDDLRHFIAGRPVIARPSSLFHRAFKLAKRYPITSTMAAGLLITVVVAFTVVGWQLKQAKFAKHTEASLRYEAEGALYTQQIALAKREIGDSECQRALAILNSTDPRKRHWEWRYLAQCCESHDFLTALGRDTRKCVVSPDGKLLAIVKGRWGTDLPGSLAVIHVNTGKLLYDVVGEFGPIMDVAFSPDGKSIATGSIRFSNGEGRIIFWNADSGEQIETLPGVSSGVFGVAFHPTQSLMAVACANHTVEIWNFESNKQIHKLNGHRDNCFKVAFSPDGKQLASCSRDGTVRLWDVASGTGDDVLHAPKDVRNIAYTPDGRYVVINGYDRAIQFWDLMKSPPVKTKVHIPGGAPASYGFSISPKGRFLVAFGDRGKRLFSYDMASSQLAVRSAETSKQTFWMAHHPINRRLFLVDADGGVFESRFRRPNPRRQVVIKQPKGFAISQNSDNVAFAPGPSRAFPGHRDYRYRSLSLKGNNSKLQLYQGAETWSSSVSFSFDGMQLFGGCDNGEILCWDVESQELLQKYVAHEGAILYLAHDSTEKDLVSIGDDGWLRRWNFIQGLATEETRICDGTIFDVTASRAGDHLAVASKDGQIQVFARGNANVRRTAKTAPVEFLARQSIQIMNAKALAISDDGNLLAVATRDHVELLSLTESDILNPIWSTSMATTGVTHMSFHPDGCRLAIIDSWLGRVTVINTENGQATLEFNARSRVPSAEIKFSRDGNTLLATLAGELFIWSASQHKPPDKKNRGGLRSRISLEDSTKSELRTDFHWHVKQVFEQSQGKHSFGAVYHARNSLKMSSKHHDVLKSLPHFEANLLKVRLHLAQELIELGQSGEETTPLEE